MTKTATQDSDRIAALEIALDEMRKRDETQAAAIAELLRQRQPEASNDVVAALLDRLDRTDPEKAKERFQKKLDEMVDKAARAALEPFRELLTGTVAYFCGALEPQRPYAKNNLSPPPVPAPGLTRLVYATDADHAILKWERHMGISEPRIHGLSKYADGVFPQAIAATAEESEPILDRCINLIAAVDSPDKIIRLMLDAGERAFAARNPKPEIETIGLA